MENTKKYRYPGTNYFLTTDADIFCGRDEDIEKLYTQVMLSDTVVLHATSGVGKSSLIRAGIIPRIKKHNTEQLKKDKKEYLPVTIKFGMKSLNEDFLIIDTLKQIKAQCQNFTLELPYINPSNDDLWYLAKTLEYNGFYLLLLFDQFEELQAYSHQQIYYFKEKLAELFSSVLPSRIDKEIENNTKELLSDKSISDETKQKLNEDLNLLETRLHSKAVFIIREDKLGTISLLSDYFPDILKNDYQLLPLTKDNARKAIKAPAQLKGEIYKTSGFRFRESVVENIVTSLSDKNTGLIDPIQIQIICSRIEKTKSDKLKVITANDLPPIRNIISDFYHESWMNVEEVSGISETALEEIKLKILGQLIINEKRNLVNKDLLIKDIPTKGEEIIKELIKAGLLVEVLQGKQVFCQLCHDRLILPALDDLKQIEAMARSREEWEEMESKVQEHEIRLKEERKRLRIKWLTVILVITSIAIIALALALGKVVRQSWDLRDESKIVQNQKIELEGQKTELKDANNSLRIERAAASDSASAYASIAEKAKKNEKLAIERGGQLKMSRDTAKKQNKLISYLLKDGFWFYYLDKEDRHMIVNTLSNKYLEGEIDNNFLNYIALAALGKSEVNKYFIRSQQIGSFIYQNTTERIARTITSKYCDKTYLPDNEIRPHKYITSFDVSIDGKKVFIIENNSNYLHIVDITDLNKSDSIYINKYSKINTVQSIPNQNKILITLIKSDTAFVYDFSEKTMQKLVIVGEKSDKLIDAKIRNIKNPFISESSIVRDRDPIIIFRLNNGRTVAYNLKNKTFNYLVDNYSTSDIINYNNNFRYRLVDEYVYVENLDNILNNNDIVNQQIKVDPSNIIKVESDNKLLCITSEDGHIITANHDKVYISYTPKNVDRNLRYYKQEIYNEDLNCFVLSGHNAQVTSLAISDKNFSGHEFENYIASGSRDNTIRLWGFYTYEKGPNGVLIGHQRPITKIRFLDKYKLISLSEDGQLLMWNIDTNALLDMIDSNSYVEAPNLSAIANYYYNQNNVELGFEFYRLAAELNGGYDEWSKLAMLYWQDRGDYMNARNAFNNAYRKDSTKIIALTYISATYYLEGMIDSALQIANYALKQNKNHGEGYYVRGMIYQSENRFDDSFDDFMQSYKLQPALINDNDWINIVEVYKDKKAFKHGKDFCKVLAENDRTMYGLWNLYGDIFLSLNKLDSALICYFESIKHDSYRYESRPFQKIDSILHVSQDSDKSFKILFSLLEDYEYSAIFIGELISLSDNNKDYTYAIKYSEIYTEVLPEDSRGWWGIGWFKLFIKDFKESLKASEKAWGLRTGEYSGEEMILINKAHALLFLGEYDKARNIYLENRYGYWKNSSMGVAIINDFKKLRLAGIVDDRSNEYMNQIEKLLNSFTDPDSQNQ